MTMSFETQGSCTNLQTAQLVAARGCSSDTTSVMLTDYQDCPLCFHGKVFSEWSGYRDAFVSLTTRNFVCPICSSNVQGVDKFALHLVSHDLRSKMLRSPSSISLNNISVICADKKLVNFAPSIPLTSNYYENCTNGGQINSTSSADTLSEKLKNNKNIDSPQDGQGRITQSKLTCMKDNSMDKCKMQDLMRRETDLLSSKSVDKYKPGQSRETQCTTESLDELLDDYSEFVQQQEANKCNSLLVFKNDETVSNKEDSIFGMTCNGNKKDNLDDPLKNTFLTQIALNQTQASFPTVSQNNRRVDASLRIQYANKKLFNDDPEPSFPSLQTEEQVTNSSLDIAKNVRGYHQFQHPPQSSCTQTENSSTVPSLNLNHQLSPSRNDSQIPINFQVPKPLYHKYFQSQCKLHDDQGTNETFTFHKDPDSKWDIKLVSREDEISSHGYKNTSPSTVENEAKSMQPNHSFPSLKNDLVRKEVDGMEINISQDNQIISQDSIFLSSNVLESTPGSILPSTCSDSRNDGLNFPSVAEASTINKNRNHNSSVESLSTSQSAVQCSLCGWNFDNENFLQLHKVLMHSPHRQRVPQPGVVSGFKTRSNFKRQAIEEFYCRECNGKAFKHHEEFSQHLKLVHNDHRYVCNICAKMFKLRGSLLVHVRVVHNPFDDEEADYHCRTCNRKFSSRQRRDVHEKRHGGESAKTTECFKCEGNVANEGKFNAHLHTHDAISSHCSPSQEEENLLSDLYDATRQTVTATIEQRDNIETIGDIIVPQHTIINGGDETIGQKKFGLISPKGELLFKSNSSTVEDPILTYPQDPKCLSDENVPTFKCNVCDKKFKRQTHLHQHSLTHEPRQWDCDVCKKTFTTKYFLKKHKRLHTGETPYSCHICGKSFTFQQSYHKHMLYHTDEKPYSCSQCGRAFKELSTLQNHERIHSGERPFACETCGKSFRQRVSYLVHRRIHTGVMPYTCNVCGKNFRYKVTQRTHKCLAKQQKDSMSPNSEDGTLQDKGKPTFPCLPQQIQEDLQKFRKAQSRRILHTRLHSYINHLCSSKQSAAPSVETRNNVAHNSNNQNPPISRESNMQQVETVHITCSQSPSATLTTTLKQEQMESPSVGLISGTCVSGESSPIGQLQQLSINEDKSLQSQFYVQQQQINDLQCRTQHMGNTMFEGVPKTLNDMFDDSTTIPKNINTSDNCDDVANRNIPHIAINNDQGSNMINYNLF